MNAAQVKKLTAHRVGGGNAWMADDQRRLMI
jgi:hypothetical protein